MVARPGPTTLHESSGTATVSSASPTDAGPACCASIHGIVCGASIHVDAKNGAEYAPTTQLALVLPHRRIPYTLPAGNAWLSSDTTYRMVSVTGCFAWNGSTQKVAAIPS